MSFWQRTLGFTYFAIMRINWHDTCSAILAGFWCQHTRCLLSFWQGVFSFFLPFWQTAILAAGVVTNQATHQKKMSHPNLIMKHSNLPENKCVIIYWPLYRTFHETISLITKECFSSYLRNPHHWDDLFSPNNNIDNTFGCARPLISHFPLLPTLISPKRRRNWRIL